MFNGLDNLGELIKLIECYCSYPNSSLADIKTVQRLKDLVYFYSSLLSSKILKTIFLNTTGHIQHINEQTEDWLGYKRVEVEKKSIFKPLFLTSESSNTFYFNFKEVLEGNPVQPFNLLWSNKKGEPLLARTSLIPIYQEGGLVRSILVIIFDTKKLPQVSPENGKGRILYGEALQDRINDLIETNNLLLHRMEKFRSTENQIKETLERIKLYESIINCSNTILFRWKVVPSWPIDFVSDNIRDFGYKPEDFLKGKITWQDFIYSEDLDAVRDRGKNYREKGQKSYNQEYRVVTKTGEIRWVFDRVEVITDSYGEDVYIQDIITDTTESKKMQDELLRYKQHLEILVEKKTDQLRTANTELTKQKEELEHKNMLLTELLNQIELEKKRIRDDVVFNIEKILLPTIRHIELDMNSVNKNYKDLLEGTIQELASSFGRKISDQSYNLSPREMEICNMIKSGLSSKEIAALINISPQVVNWHRNNIRKKMGLLNKKMNLVIYLKNL